jgi:hypothetical protein
MNNRPFIFCMYSKNAQVVATLLRAYDYDYALQGRRRLSALNTPTQ